MRHIGAGKLDVNKIGPDDPRYSPQLANSISDNHVRSATFFSLGLTYKLRALGRDDGLEIFSVVDNLFDALPTVAPGGEIGSASWRERVCQYVSISVVGVTLSKQRHTINSAR